MSPEDVIVPPAGRASPARILVRVVFPAPLRPTSPIRSPAAIRKETSSISRRAPARTSSLDTVITTGLSGGEDGARRRAASWGGSGGVLKGRWSLVYEAIAPGKDTRAFQPEGPDRPEPDRDPRRRRWRWRWRDTVPDPARRR